MNALETAAKTESRSDFVAFVRALRRSFEEDPAQWENQDLSSYLDALAAWVEDMDGYFQGTEQEPPDRPSWKLLAQMLAAARVYE
jgi:hypothetical protein